MKKTLATLLSILLPAAAMPVSSSAAGKPLQEYLNPQEKALWHLPGTNDDAKCALDAEMTEELVRECRSRISKAVDAYLSDASLPADGWSPAEAAYVGNIPEFQNNSGSVALGALFKDGKLTACENPEDNATLVRRMRQLIRKDLLGYREGNPEDSFTKLVANDFAGGKVSDCASARRAADAKHLAMRDAIINNLTPLENAIMKDIHRTPAAQDEFLGAAHMAALGTSKDRQDFYKKYRALARAKAAKANSLPRINGKADSVLGFLSATDENFLNVAVGLETRKKIYAKIADADAKAQSGDTAPALELARRIRAMVTASLTNYAASTADIDAQDQLRKIDEISEIALNPGTSLEESIGLIQKKFDGSRIEDEVVLMPEETAPGHKPNVTVGEGELAHRRDKTDVPSPDRVSEVQTDKQLDNSAAKDDAAAAKKTRLFKQDMLGAAYGAIGLGFFGLIFGGPIGALVAAVAGAAIVGGMTHLVNSDFPS